MSGYPIFLLGSIFISSMICIVGRFMGKDIIKYIFKPLTTLLIILLALLSNDPFSFYNSFLLAGLGFALLGDVLLMLPKDRLPQGIFAFAVAIILFSIVCMQAPGPYFLWGAFIPVLIFAIIFILVVVRRMGNLKIPAIIYVIIMSNFLLQAAGRAWYIAEDGTGFIFAGAVLFALSDTIISYERFIKKFRLAPVIYMTLYWTSLTLIALSIY